MGICDSAGNKVKETIDSAKKNVKIFWMTKKNILI